MAFSEDQIDRLRSRLCAYRAQKGSEGRPRPWKTVLNDILMSEATAHCYPEDGSEPEFKEEALRRFAAGTSIPTQDKLEDIQTFLLDKKFLTRESLTDGIWDYTTALSLRSLFGEVAHGKELLNALKGQFRAEYPEKKGPLEGTARYDLGIEPVENEGMMKIRQTWFKWLYGDIAEMKAMKKYDDQIRSQSGFGYFSGNNELTLFFKDGFTGEMDIFVLTDLMTIERNQPVAWFQAARINGSFNWSSKAPGQPGNLSLKKYLYRNLETIQDTK